MGCVHRRLRQTACPVPYNIDVPGQPSNEGRTMVTSCRSQVLRLGNVVPDFSAQTTQGDMPSFHDWIDGSWAILFSHPADFTVRPVLAEILAVASSLVIPSLALPDVCSRCCIATVVAERQRPGTASVGTDFDDLLLQPVCTTEIGRLALKYKELESKGVKLATLSCDPVTSHQKWLEDVVAHCENKARACDKGLPCWLPSRFRP